MIRSQVLSAGIIGMALASAAVANAAEITSVKLANITAISIVGPITAEDRLNFDKVADSAANYDNGPTVVVLDSPGGDLLAGLSLGQSLRSKGLATAVVSGSHCASVCALIWLAGTKRLLGNTARIGFHAAYVGLGDDAKESGQGNAFVGAYLSRLGLSYSAIAFATAAGPDELQWLHPADAKRVGILLEVLPDPVQQSTPVQATPDPPAETPAEDKAKALVTAYYAIWSGSGADVDGLSQFYAPSANYYGTAENRELIMDDKRKFSLRWPVRAYTIRPNTLYAQCADTCSVTGVVQWDVSSPGRGAHSTGTTNFVLKIAIDGSPAGGIILSENGAVLAAHNDNLPSAQASLASSNSDASVQGAYAAGRQARIEYEAWFNRLPVSDYRSGAEFWAESRSLKAPPLCTRPSESTDWQNGCIAAKSWLSPIDARRRAEKDYWFGWNSL